MSVFRGGDNAVERRVNLFKGNQCRMFVYSCLVSFDNHNLNYRGLPTVCAV